ncbi:MAG: tRNA uridine-5-carboxymethylaminomethyl(34) synthesis GTPase MnmE [Acidobacteriota bacterium]
MRALGAYDEETIVAPATPAGRSGLAVVRLSGPNAWRIVRECVRRKRLEDRRATVGTYFSVSGEAIDQIVFTCYRGPRSYTGEDLVEISCHGNPLIVEKIVRDCVERGARLAERGEFTLRAFLHGKLDLVQAEAVRELIEGHTWEQVKAAQGSLGGHLRAELDLVRERVVEVVVQLETRLEFVEDDISPEEDSRLKGKLELVAAQLREWLSRYERSRVIRQGFKVVLVGLPNVGKSSLFNRLLDEDRAIVTAWPGTTRDTLREWRDVLGVPVCLVDTAGLRGVVDEVERIGVERAQREMEGADAVLLVVDATCSPTEEVRKLWVAAADKRRLLVINKIDLCRGEQWVEEFRSEGEEPCFVSAREGTGVPGVWRWLEGVIQEEAVGDKRELLLVNERQRDCVDRAYRSVVEAGEGLKRGKGEELVVEELRKALRALGELVGETTPDDILQGIFATFCIGK